MNRVRKLVAVAGNPLRFSRFTGIASNAVRNWIRFSAEPSPKSLAIIAYKSGISPEWLLRGSGDEAQEIAKFRARFSDAVSLKSTYPRMISQIGPDFSGGDSGRVEETSDHFSTDLELMSSETLTRMIKDITANVTLSADERLRRIARYIEALSRKIK